MSKRFPSFRPKFTGKGPNGRRLCVWCGKECSTSRQRWCSSECVHEMKIQHWPGYWAAHVIKRDKGVCQLCGFDSKLLERVRQSVFWYYNTLPYDSDASEEARILGWKVDRFIKEHMRSQGFSRWGSYVEADHIIPIAEGGPNTLENGRMLCQPCHRGETKKLAGRMKAERRKNAKTTGMLFDFYTKV